MWLIDKSAGPAVNFVPVFVEGPIGISTHWEAKKLADEITQAIIIAREHDPDTDFVWRNIQREDNDPQP
jgi:hypothetical protein